MVSTILVDDHEIVRNGIRILLEQDGHVKVLAEASEGSEAIAKVGEFRPNLVIMDIRMPGMNGLQATQLIKRDFPDVKVLILSMHEDEEFIVQAVELGADGYLLKDTNKQEFIKAIDTIMSGQKYFSGDISNVLINSFLNPKPKPQIQQSTETANGNVLTKRENQILSLIYKGVSNKQIAEDLNKSVRTIETHRFNIMKKLRVSNIAELLRKVEADPSLKSIAKPEQV